MAAVRCQENKIANCPYWRQLAMKIAMKFLQSAPEANV
jgi:hypothetical protein